MLSVIISSLKISKQIIHSILGKSVEMRPAAVKKLFEDLTLLCPSQRLGQQSFFKNFGLAALRIDAVGVSLRDPA
jgi:hypothetical protein